MAFPTRFALFGLLTATAGYFNGQNRPQSFLAASPWRFHDQDKDQNKPTMHPTIQSEMTATVFDKIDGGGDHVDLLVQRFLQTCIDDCPWNIKHAAADEDISLDHVQDELIYKNALVDYDKTMYKNATVDYGKTMYMATTTAAFVSNNHDLLTIETHPTEHSVERSEIWKREIAMASEKVASAMESAYNYSADEWIDAVFAVLHCMVDGTATGAKVLVSVARPIICLIATAVYWLIQKAMATVTTGIQSAHESIIDKAYACQQEAFEAYQQFFENQHDIHAALFVLAIGAFYEVDYVFRHGLSSKRTNWTMEMSWFIQGVGLAYLVTCFATRDADKVIAASLMLGLMTVAMSAALQFPFYKARARLTQTFKAAQERADQFAWKRGEAFLGLEHLVMLFVSMELEEKELAVLPMLKYLARNISLANSYEEDKTLKIMSQITLIYSSFDFVSAHELIELQREVRKVVDPECTTNYDAMCRHLAACVNQHKKNKRTTSGTKPRAGAIVKFVPVITTTNASGRTRLTHCRNSTPR